MSTKEEAKMRIEKDKSPDGMSFQLANGKWANIPVGAYFLLSDAFSTFWRSWGNKTRSNNQKKGKKT